MDDSGVAKMSVWGLSWRLKSLLVFESASQFIFETSQFCQEDVEVTQRELSQTKRSSTQPYWAGRNPEIPLS